MIVYLVSALLSVSLQSTASARVLIRASSQQPGSEIQRALDRNDTTSWCGAEEPPRSGKVNLSKSIFKRDDYNDWWEMEFEHSTQTIGAIYMKSGAFQNGRVTGHKIRNFVWAFQRNGEDQWHKIPETDIYADRAQLIFRFQPIWGIHKLRLFMRARDNEEKNITGSNAPCLREVRVYENRDADIPVQPWFYAVATWEEGNKYNPLLHWGRISFRVEEAVRAALMEITGVDSAADVTDEMWIGEFNPSASNEKKSYAHWIMHEPAPSGFLYSGNYLAYNDVHPSYYFGFYNFMQTHFADAAMLGACGGHQLIAMAMTHQSYDSFKTEFDADRIDQTVVTCSTNPEYRCGSHSAKDCCYEGGTPDPFRLVSPNVPAFAMPNAFTTDRYDMLFNFLQSSGPQGFKAYLYHEDYVNPWRISPFFDVIATYPATVARPDPAHPSLVQAMKLKSFPVYGSQFHWDENETGSCSRDEGNRNMERILKNFVLIALNRTAHASNAKITASSNQESAQNAFDLNRNSMWCGQGSHEGGDPNLTIEFNNAIPIRYIMAVEGDSIEDASQQTARFQTSNNGMDWADIDSSRVSMHSRQSGCAQLPGQEDHQTFLYTLAEPVRAKYLRINWKTPRPSACAREVFVLKDLL